MNDSEETMATEDALWDAVAAQHADKQTQTEARIAAARVLPMFDKSGRWLVDDYTDADFEDANREARGQGV